MVLVGGIIVAHTLDIKGFFRMAAIADWVIEDCEALDLGDKRLNHRAKTLLSTLSANPKKSISGACNGWAETMAAYRFLDNESVTPAKILSPHKKATLQRIQQEKILLMIQDTTEIKYEKRDPIEGLGKMSYPLEQGLHFHPTLVVTPAKVCLGVMDAMTWTREELGKKAKRFKKQINEKESMRWLNSYNVSNEIAKVLPDSLVVNVADREGDIYDLFSQRDESDENAAHWLVRSSQDRRLLDPETKEPLVEKLRERASKATVLGHFEFHMPETNKRTGRIVKQEVRGRRICIRAPHNKGAGAKMIEATIILYREKKPPKGEKPVEWFLLTSLPLESAERGFEIVEWYLCRWQIEIFFKILKTGCEVEELQLQTHDRIVNCLALYTIIAWRILYITMLGRDNPDLSCDMVFSKDEWNAVYAVVQKKHPPKEPPSLYAMIRMIAGLGGFLGRKRDGEPGPQCMWIGMQRMQDFALAWPIFRDLK